MESKLLSQKGLEVEVKKVAKKLQERATEEAIASTAMSRKNSPFEGNKLWGGSSIELSEDFEVDDLEGELCFGFGRFLGVDEDMLRLDRQEKC